MSLVSHWSERFHWVVYNRWTGMSGLEWWTGMVELLICSLGVIGQGLTRMCSRF